MSAEYLEFLNKEYFKLHKKYEELFWLSYMGDHSVDQKMDEALAVRDAFRANAEHVNKIKQLLKGADAKTKKRLKDWLHFFSYYQSSPEAAALKKQISNLESSVLKRFATRAEGYIDPHSKKFISASAVKMRTMIATHEDEKIRKACFMAREELAQDVLPKYVEIIKLRNEYARELGYNDFYDFKVQREDGMTKKELFNIFDSIYEKTKYAHKNIRELEKKMPGLRKPWNFSYMMAGDFTKEEDPYFQFDEALIRWGKSFAALGIYFCGGSLKLDLLERKGKWHNGFCHWPDLIKYQNGRKYAGSSNFTCNVVLGQIGSGHEGYDTLFHEGGHAAHLLNSEQIDSCFNHEYAPMSTSWAETQSMFLEGLFSGIDWKTRYAVNDVGNKYPFDLFERRIKKLNIIRPLGLSSIIFVSNFEREIYEAKDLTPEKVLHIARKNFKKYFDRSEDSLMALNVPHIYSWESSAAYHGYGLAELAVHQWREYFYKKHGYIVDNPKVGAEMKKVWKWGSAKFFSDFVVLATGNKLSARPYLKDVTLTAEQIINNAKKKIKRLEQVKPYEGTINLNATIKMVHGVEEISNNRKSFEDMAEKYKKWLRKSK